MSLSDKLKPHNGLDVNKVIEEAVKTVTTLPPPEKQYVYALVGIDNINLQLAGETVSAQLGRVILDQAQHDELQKLIKKGNRQDITQQLRLIDMDEAERIAREHLATVRRQAGRGASSTQERVEMVNEMAKDPQRNLDVIEEEVLHAGDGPLGDLDNQ